jgi:hypothetical protein
MRPKTSRGSVGDVRDGLLGVHRPGHAEDIEPFGAEGRFGRRDAFCIAAVEDDRRAVASQAQGAGPANARVGGRPGHDGDLSGELPDVVLGNCSACVRFGRPGPWSHRCILSHGVVPRHARPGLPPQRVAAPEAEDRDGAAPLGDGGDLGWREKTWLG